MTFPNAKFFLTLRMISPTKIRALTRNVSLEKSSRFQSINKRSMRNIFLFCVGLMSFQQAFSQTVPAISGFVARSGGGGANTSNFSTNLLTAYEVACSLLNESPNFENMIVGGLDNGRPICWNPDTGSFQYLTYSHRHVCLVESGYERASFDSSLGYHSCSVPEDEATEDTGCAGDNGAGNPCNVATGNKYQSETDFNNSSLVFRRSYNSQNLVNLGLGMGWRHNYQRKLSVDGNTLIRISGNGRGEPWIKNAGVWQGDADSDIAIVETSSGFELTRANNVVENYNSVGQLLSITDTNGQVISYTYNASNQLEKVTNQYGSSVDFTYDEFYLRSVTDALDNEYRFEYYPNGNLESVIYPDTTPSDDTDNPRRTYHYEDSNYPSHLTGITDENGDRYATWAYNADGKAILTKHAETSTEGVGQETFELDYQAEAVQ